MLSAVRYRLTCQVSEIGSFWFFGPFETGLVGSLGRDLNKNAVRTTIITHTLIYYMQSVITRLYLFIYDAFVL